MNNRGGPSKILWLIVLGLAVFFFGGPILNALFPFSPPPVTTKGPSTGADATTVATTGIPKTVADAWVLPSAALVCDVNNPDRCKAYLVTDGATIYNHPVAVSQEILTQMFNTWDISAQSASVDVHLIPGVLIYDKTSQQFNFDFERRGNDLVMVFKAPVTMFRAYADNRRFSDPEGNWVNTINERVNGHKDTALFNALSQQIDNEAKALACAKTDPNTGVALQDASGKDYLENAKAIFSESLVGIVAARWDQKARPEHILVEFPDAPCYLLPDAQRPAGVPGGPPPVQ